MARKGPAICVHLGVERQINPLEYLTKHLYRASEDVLVSQFYPALWRNKFTAGEDSLVDSHPLVGTNLL